CCLRLTVAGSASGATHFRGHLAFTCVTARTTRTYPAGRIVEGLQRRRFPSGLPSELRGFRFLPRQVWLLLSTPAFPARTTVLETFTSYGSSSHLRHDFSRRPSRQGLPVNPVPHQQAGGAAGSPQTDAS